MYADKGCLQRWDKPVNKLIGLTFLLASTSTASTAESPRFECRPVERGDARMAYGTAVRHLYVEPGGSDDNAGTHHAPFRTIARAANAATPGTTVHVAPGIYRENIKTHVHGTAAARIRYVSDIKWAAKIIGTGTEAMWANKGHYTDIIGFDISGSGRMGIANHASHTLVAGNYVHRLSISGGCTSGGGAGIVNTNYDGSDGDIVGNVVHDIGVPGQCNQVQGLYSSNRGGRIVNNIVFRVSSYGIHLWHAADRVLIANNTVFANGAVGMGGGILLGAEAGQGAGVLSHTKVINNIVYDNPAASIREYCYTGQECIGPNNIVANNLVHRNGSGISLRAGSAIGTVTGDPQFLNYRPNGIGNYRLKRGSPAIGMGLRQCAPLIDIDNAARPRWLAPDLGAYQQR